jgi:UDP-GlcNAc:undecaprenyl-phosphate/decaprenyl-phosphate GlcNAc-1-phosphate transferase
MMSDYISTTAYMFEAVLAAALLTLAAGWLAIRAARRARLMDIPGSAPHKKHRYPTPLAGGIALMLALLPLAYFSGLWRQPGIGVLLVGAVVVFIFGLWDDARKITALPKLTGQVLAALIIVASGVHIQIFESADFFIGGPDPLYLWLDRLLTIFWIVGITNALNLVDSWDGLSVGLSAWAFGFFMLATFDSQQHDLSLLSALLLGACLSLNYFNLSPSRLFLGDSGAQLLGFLLAAIAILYTPTAAAQTSSWFVPILLLGVPIFDTTLVFFSRLRRGSPFYSSGSDHTFHRLVYLGFEPPRAVTIMHLAALLLECAAFIAASLHPVWANSVFIVCLLFGIAAVAFLETRALPAAAAKQ